MKKLICLLLMLCLSASALADGAGQNMAVVKQTYAYVITDTPGSRLNLRTGPGVKYATQGKYYAGVQVELLGKRSNGFAQVRIGAAEGWMQESYLSSTKKGTEIPVGRVSNNGGSGANLRSKPSTKDGSILQLYPNGTAVQVLGVLENDWLHVQVGQKDGYMLGRLLNIRLSFTDKNKHEYIEPGSMYISTGHRDTFAPVYAYPDTGSEVVAEELSKDMVIVQEYASGGWARIWSGPVQGWIQTMYLADLDAKVVDGRRSTIMMSGNKQGTVPIYSSGNRQEIIAWEDSNELFHIRAVLPDGWVFGWTRNVGQGGLVRAEQLSEPVYMSTRMDKLYVSVQKASVRLHLREKPDAKSASLGRFWNGTEVYVTAYGPDRQWVQVVVGDLQGWMSKAYLTDDLSKVNESRIQGVTKKRTVMYAAPHRQNTWSPATLEAGTQVRVLGVTDDHWVYVVWQDAAGWISADDLQVDDGISL